MHLPPTTTPQVARLRLRTKTRIRSRRLRPRSRPLLKLPRPQRQHPRLKKSPAPRTKAQAGGRRKTRTTRSSIQELLIHLELYRPRKLSIRLSKLKKIYRISRMPGRIR